MIQQENSEHKFNYRFTRYEQINYCVLSNELAALMNMSTWFPGLANLQEALEAW